MMILCNTEAFGWSEIMWITLIGLALVFCVLVLLIYVIRLFGTAFTARKRPSAAEPVATAAELNTTTAEVAVIAAALYLGDRSSRTDAGVLTFAPRGNSAWNSKIFTLTNLPERKQ